MIDAAGLGGITIDTGGAPVTNTGTIEATGVGEYSFKTQPSTMPAA